jgi:hypothetical protein
MAVGRRIHNTAEVARWDWPDDCYIHGGEQSGRVDALGRVVPRVFFEAYPRDPLPTYLRGDGSSMEEAEDEAWSLFAVYRACPHPEFEARTWRNGSGHCVRCRLWFPAVLPGTATPQDAPLGAKAVAGDAAMWLDQDDTATQRGKAPW